MGHTSFQMSRRALLRAGLSSAGALALGPAFFERAFAAGPVTPTDGPYGPLGAFDGNGIALPKGFSSREIARGGDLVPGTGYLWHPFTDGQATFATLGPGGAPDGGWILTANSEVPVPLAGGVSAVEFGPQAEIRSAYRVLSGTMTNCAGGPAPWGAWLSCEEHGDGMVHECDPTRLNTGVARPALGVFQHEAVCVDPVLGRLYLTEDESDGRLYRFTPSAYPDLSEGLLEVAVGPTDGEGRAMPGTLDWVTVPDPGGGGSNPTRHQVVGASIFRGGEGIWFDNGVVYFTTKGDNRVWTYRVADRQLDVLYDPETVGPDAPLQGVDNITVSPSGDIFVCEDGADHDICMVTPQFEVARFLKLDPVKHAGAVGLGNETVGVVFNPAGDRMYFGAQRSFGLATGVVYEIRGPFRGATTGPSGPSGPPQLKLRAKKRFRSKRVWRRGFPIRFETDRPVGVKATLRVPVKGRDGKKHWKLVARGKSSVAVADLAALRLRPTKAARKILAKRGDTVARLRVVATDPRGRRTVRRRKVRLIGND